MKVAVDNEISGKWVQINRSTILNIHFFCISQRETKKKVSLI